MGQEQETLSNKPEPETLDLIIEGAGRILVKFDEMKRQRDDLQAASNRYLLQKRAVERPARLLKWTVDTLGPEAGTVKERARRLLEEVCEVAQAAGLTLGEGYEMAREVWNKPTGELSAELAQVVITTEACAAAAGVDLVTAADDEEQRIMSISPEVWRERHAAKGAAAAGPAATPEWSPADPGNIQTETFGGLYTLEQIEQKLASPADHYWCPNNVNAPLVSLPVIVLKDLVKKLKMARAAVMLPDTKPGQGVETVPSEPWRIEKKPAGPGGTMVVPVQEMVSLHDEAVAAKERVAQLEKELQLEKKRRYDAEAAQVAHLRSVEKEFKTEFERVKSGRKYTASVRAGKMEARIKKLRKQLATLSTIHWTEFYDIAGYLLNGEVRLQKAYTVKGYSVGGKYQLLRDASGVDWCLIIPGGETKFADKTLVGAMKLAERVNFDRVGAFVARTLEGSK